MAKYTFEADHIGKVATAKERAVLPKKDAFGQPYNAAIGGLNYHHISPTEFVVVQGGAAFDLTAYETASAEFTEPRAYRELSADEIGTLGDASVTPMSKRLKDG